MSYHDLLLLAGLAIVASFWLPRLISERKPAASALLILAGFAFTWFTGESRALFDPIDYPKPWEIVSELTVIIALFATGMRLDVLRPYAKWTPTWRLLGIAMPLCIAGTVAAGLIGGLPIVAALLLGAVLAPTDPVLAGDVQVGGPTEGGEHPVRFALTTEAGLNDGLAFPFVYFALVAIGGLTFNEGLVWFGYDVVYRILVGTAVGLGVGWVLARLVFHWPADNALAQTGSGVLALAGVLVCYGLAELLHGYGFIAAFAGGLAFRRVEQNHEFHSDMHTFNESLEHALTAALLLVSGAALGLYADLVRWDHVAIAAALIFLIRPVTAWLSLIGTSLWGRERFVTAAFGVRGIGSIYYLAFAAGKEDIPQLDDLWLIVLVAIAMSAFVHGLSAGAALERIKADTA